jgi:hypothetical protein
VRDDLHVAVPHAPEVVEEEDVPVDEAHGPGAGKERPGKRDPHRQRQDQALQRRAERSCMHIRDGKKTRSAVSVRPCSQSSGYYYSPVSEWVTGEEWCMAWYCLKSGPRCSALWAQ